MSYTIAFPYLVLGNTVYFFNYRLGIFVDPIDYVVFIFVSWNMLFLNHNTCDLYLHFYY